MKVRVDNSYIFSHQQRSSAIMLHTCVGHLVNPLIISATLALPLSRKMAHS